MTFSKTVAVVMGCVLLISLIIIGIMMYYDKNSYVYPSKVSECPDYWVDSGYARSKKNRERLSSDIEPSDLTPGTCINIKNLGTCPDQRVKNFDEPPFNKPGSQGPASGVCRKSKWAKRCNITWDGITNNPQICSNP